MKKSLLFAVALSALIAVIGCSRPAPDATSSDTGAAPSSDLKGRLTLTGSSTVAPLASELAKAFEQAHPEVRIDVQSGGSSRGIADARRGIADIGMISRSLKPDETDLTAHLIALDGISIIVHRDNPVAALDDEQIVGIFTGKHRRWSDVGGPDAPVTVVNKAEGRSTLELFLSHFKLTNEQVAASVVIGDNQQGVRTVVGDVNAISYVSTGTAEYEASNGTAIRLLPIGGVEASLANIRSKTYALSRELNLVTLGNPNPLAEAFIAYAQSPEAYPVIEGQYFVPIAQ